MKNKIKDDNKQSKKQNKLVKTKNVFSAAADLILDTSKMAIDFSKEVSHNVKKVFDDVNTNLQDNSTRKKLEKYKPIFIDNVPNNYPKILYVVDYNNRMKIKECEGAVGFYENISNAEVVCIYQSDFDKFPNIEFYPNNTPVASVYYEHPIVKNQYIDINEYFEILNKQRVNELEEIAISLGAKYFRVRIVESTKSSDETKTDAKVKIKLPNQDSTDLSIDKKNEQNNYRVIGIESEMRLPGGEPKAPELRLWSKDESINNLIKQRLSDYNRIQSKIYSLNYNTGTGIKEKEAAQIDGVLKGLKIGVSGSVQKKVKEEGRKRLEYCIEF